jgi:hypothetical protein
MNETEPASEPIEPGERMLPAQSASEASDALSQLAHSQEATRGDAEVDPLQLAAALGKANEPAGDELSQQLASEDFGNHVVGRAMRPDRRDSSLLVRLAGHIVFALLGLALGYYILCWIDPRGNVLHLPLPGIGAPRPIDGLFE